MGGEFNGFFKTTSRVSSYMTFVLRFLRALQQSRAQSRLLYLLNDEVSRIFQCFLLLRNHA